MNKEAYLLGYSHKTASKEEMHKMAFQLAYAKAGDSFDKNAGLWDTLKGGASAIGTALSAGTSGIANAAKGGLGNAAWYVGKNTLKGTAKLFNHSPRLLGMNSFTGMADNAWNSAKAGAMNKLKEWGGSAAGFVKKNWMPFAMGAMALGGGASMLLGGKGGSGGSGQGGPTQSYNGPNAMNSHQGGFDQFNQGAFDG